VEKQHGESTDTQHYYCIQVYCIIMYYCLFNIIVFCGFGFYQLWRQLDLHPFTQYYSTIISYVRDFHVHVKWPKEKNKTKYTYYTGRTYDRKHDSRIIIIIIICALRTVPILFLPSSLYTGRVPENVVVVVAVNAAALRGTCADGLPRGWSDVYRRRRS